MGHTLFELAEAGPLLDFIRSRYVSTVESSSDKLLVNFVEPSTNAHSKLTTYTYRAAQVFYQQIATVLVDPNLPNISLYQE